MTEPNTIDHNPNEKRQPWWLWWVAWAFVALLWLGQWYTDGFEWDNIMLGIGTGVLLASWAIDIGGVETPASWRRKTMRRR